jgi:hypothetical protein
MTLSFNLLARLGIALFCAVAVFNLAYASTESGVIAVLLGVVGFIVGHRTAGVWL